MKEALIVVDYQNDFIDGSLGFEGADTIAAGIKEEIMRFQEMGQDIMFTVDTHNSDYLKTQEGRLLPVEHCMIDTDGIELHKDIKGLVRTTDKVFHKPTFGAIEFAKYLETKDYQRLTFVGLVTNICVISNAVLAKAALPEAEIIIKKDLVMSFDGGLHQKALDVMAGLQMLIV